MKHRVWLLACMLLASQVARQRSLHGESQNVQRQLMLYAQALGQRIDRYRTLPEVLALDPELRAALTHALTPAEVDRLNRKLEQANGASQSSTLTLLDLSGRALAASNWRDAHSNVGVDACRMVVPVVTDDGAAAAIYPRRLEDWENQPSESTRTEFLDRLAWWQWSANESRSMWNWLLAQLG